MGGEDTGYMLGCKMFPGVRGAGPDWSCGRPTTGRPSPAPGEATSSPVQSSPVQSSLETESSVWCFSSHCPVVGRIRSSGHNRFNCFLCNFDLCESCVYRKAQRPSLVGNILKTFIFLLPKQTYIMYHLDERVELRKLGKSVLGLEEEQRRNRQSWLFPPTAPVIEEEEPPPSYQQAVTASPLPVWILQFYE